MRQIHAITGASKRNLQRKRLQYLGRSGPKAFGQN